MVCYLALDLTLQILPRLDKIASIQEFCYHVKYFHEGAGFYDFVISIVVDKVLINVF